MINLHPELRSVMVYILQNCLNSRNRRYQSCEELLLSIDKALYYAVPSQLATKMETDEKLVWSDIQKYLEKRNAKDLMSTFQYHLYSTPLYRWKPAESKNLNVLIIGCGDYAQKFLDTCLIVGQIPNVNLNVTIVSDDISDFELIACGSIQTEKNSKTQSRLFEIYKDMRPELKNFFAIDEYTPADNYGHINFEQKAL